MNIVDENLQLSTCLLIILPITDIHHGVPF